MINDPLQINIKENYSKVKVETKSETEDQCDMKDLISSNHNSESGLFSCPYCSYSTKQNSSFKHHLQRLHHQGETLRCKEPGCEYTSIYESNLRRHYEGKHLRGDKVPSCPICGIRPKSKGGNL